MKLGFLYHPVSNLEESIQFYRNAMGLEVAWREGEHTVALRIPGTDNVELMLEDDPNEVKKPGGMFIVESVDAFYEARKEQVTFLREPCDIPPGRYAIFQDESGNVVRIIDMTTHK